MKKIIALLMVIFTMGMMTACDLFSYVQDSSSEISESQDVVNSEESSSELESEENSNMEESSEIESEESSDLEDEGSSEEESKDVVSSLTGGGDFNAGDNYN